MPTVSPEYLKKWKESHPEEVKKHNTTANKNRIVRKRCPECGKHRVFRKSLVTDRPIIRCKHCGTRLRIIKTLSVSEKNAHGLKLKVV